jgi:hypothetical protein
MLSKNEENESTRILVSPRRLSDLTLIYCGKAEFGHLLPIFLVK